MLEYMRKAEDSKKPVEGFNGYSPLIVLYSNLLAYMLACDLAHNMKVCFKHIIKLFKGKRKMAKFKKPTYKKQIRETYKDRENDIPQRHRSDLEARTTQWKAKVAGQQAIEEVV